MQNPLSLTALSCLVLATTQGCSKAPEVPEISFAKDVTPIIATNCLECHQPEGAGHRASGLLMSTEQAPKTLSYEELIKGTRYGSIIIAGDPMTSALNMLVEGRADPSIKMPHGKDELSDADKKTLNDWVEQGAKNN